MILRSLAQTYRLVLGGLGPALTAASAAGCRQAQSQIPAPQATQSESERCEQYRGRIRALAADSVAPGTIRGQATQLRTGAPVPKATVRLDDARGGTTQTDSSGAFALEGIEPGPHYVRVLHISYKGLRA